MKESELNNNYIVKANKSFKWTTLAEIMAKLLAPIMNMILARFILPEVFGIVASISIIITFAELISEGGFSRVIVQKKINSDEDIKKISGTANVSTIVISLLIFVAIAIFQNPLAELVKCKGYGLFLMITAIQIPLYGFSSIQTAIAKRKFDYKWIAIIRVSCSIVRLAVSVAFAVSGHGIEALIFGALISTFIQSLLLVVIYRRYLSFRFSLKCFKEMFVISLLFFFESFVSWLTTSLDTFLIALFFDQTTNGLYKNAFSTESGIIAIATAIYSSIMISLLSRYQDDETAFNKIVCKYQRIISYLIVPLGIGMFIYRNELTLLFFGEGWEGAAIIFGVFAIGECFKSATGLFIMAGFTAKGKPLWNILANIVGLIWTIISYVCFARFGFDVFVYLRSISFYLTSLFCLIVGKIILKIDLLAMLKNLGMPLFISMFMIAVAIFQAMYYPNYYYFGIGLCIVIYFFLFYMLSNCEFKDLIKIIRGKESNF